MKLANIEFSGLTRVAVAVGDELVDLTTELGIDWGDAPKFLGLGPEADAIAKRCVKNAKTRLHKDAVKFRSPVLMPEKLLGIGMNYHSFVEAVKRIGMPIPTQRIWFYRPRTCIVGPHDDIWLPRVANELEYEAELAIVIGRQCRSVSVADAPAMIAGYTVGNDLTLRQRIPQSIVFAKSYDTHTPLGPWIVTSDEVGDPHRLALKTWVNGELRQKSTTAEMIANCYELVAEISASCTLNPGDVILSGTPDGSGFLQKPPVTLAAGDVIKIEIERVGVIENRVVNEPL